MAYFTASGSKVTGVKKAVAEFNEGLPGTILGLYGGYSGKSPEFDTEFVVFPNKAAFTSASHKVQNGQQPLKAVHTKKNVTEKCTMLALYTIVEQRFGLVKR